MAPRKLLSLEERFWPKVKVGSETECWPWLGALTGDGYGYLGATPASVKGPKIPSLAAPRAAWKIATGEDVPRSISVCHTCDNPLCVNPAHLFLGTQVDNNNDRIAKGRNSRMPGQSNPAAKLTPAQVVEIRNRYAAGGVTQWGLADEYGVKQAQISRIVRGVSYLV
jgi:hypothetical protein